VRQDLTFQQRIATIQVGLAMFLDHPVMGLGIGCSLLAWPLYAPDNLYTRGWLMSHNTFIQAGRG
jgi:O-antigen ligase